MTLPVQTGEPPMTDETADHSVKQIVGRMGEVADRDCVQMRDMIEAFGSTSFLPVIMVPALLVVSPLSGIPLFSSACGLTIAFIAAQMVARRDHLWLPDFLMRREVDGERARNAVDKLRKVATWLDRYSRERLQLLVRGPGRKWVQVLCLFCGLSMPLLEIVPFSSSILGAAVLFLSISLLVRDGLFALLGMATMCVVALVPFYAVNSLGG